MSWNCQQAVDKLKSLHTTWSNHYARLHKCSSSLQQYNCQVPRCTKLRLTLLMWGKVCEIKPPASWRHVTEFTQSCQQQYRKITDYFQLQHYDCQVIRYTVQRSFKHNSVNFQSPKINKLNKKRWYTTRLSHYTFDS